jgi:hypothetical protein
LVKSVARKRLKKARPEFIVERGSRLWYLSGDFMLSRSEVDSDK